MTITRTKIQPAIEAVLAPTRAPKQAPAFVVERAKNREANRKLAQALRDASIEPNGLAWTLAKQALAQGGSIGSAVAAARQ